MHTYSAADGTRFHYNSDLSGEIIVAVYGYAEVRIPSHDLLAFVAEWIRMQRISLLEDASPAEILGLPSSVMPSSLDR